MSLLPAPIAFVHRVTITDRAASDGSQAIGLIYRFLANVTDAATIPRVCHTVVYVEPWETLGSRAVNSVERIFHPRQGATSEPWVWRCADDITNVDPEDDAPASAAFKAEARRCWAGLAGDITRRMGRMHGIGLHEDIIARAADPLRLRKVEIRTLRHDMLALMVALGSAEIARCASVLRQADEKTANRSPAYGSTLERFLWPGGDEIPERARLKYDVAVAKGYCALHSDQDQ